MRGLFGREIAIRRDLIGEGMLFDRLAIHDRLGRACGIVMDGLIKRIGRNRFGQGGVLEGEKSL